MVDAHKRKLTKHLSLIIRVGITILACGWVTWSMDFSKVGNEFEKPSFWTWLAVVGIFIFSNILLSLRWWLFMRGWDIYIGFWSTIKLVFLGLYFNNCLPGSVGGDLVRAWYVAQYTNRRMASVISVFVDRVLALLGTIIIAVSAFLAVGKAEIFTRQGKSGISRISPNILIILCILMGILLLTILVVMTIPSGRKFVMSLYRKSLEYGKRALSQVFQACFILIKKPYLLPESLALTFILQGLVVLSLWLIGKQMGIPAEWKMYFVFFPVMWVVGSIPIGIAGLGIVEGGLLYLFIKYGSASDSAATALALSQRLIWIVSSLPGLVVYLSGRHLPKDIIRQFSVDEKKTI